MTDNQKKPKSDMRSTLVLGIAVLAISIIFISVMFPEIIAGLSVPG